MIQTRYKGIYFTNHALDRLKARNLRKIDAWAVWNNPDNKRFASNQGAWIYSKQLDHKKVEVVAKKGASQDWIVLSVWVKNINSHPNLKVNKYNVLKTFLKLFNR